MFSHNLNYAIAWTVAHSLWQAMLIAFVVGIALILLQKKSAKLRYLIANVGLVSVFLSALITFFMYYNSSKEVGTFAYQSLNSYSDIQISNLDENNELAKLDIIKNENKENINSYTTDNERFSIGGLKNFFNRNIYLIATLWVIGMMVFMLRLLSNISYIYYLRNRHNFPTDEYWQTLLDGLRERVQLAKHIELVESALVRSPLVIGYIKPMILFPIGAINRLNINEVEAILAHELAHVMRHDYLFNILQNVIEVLFYFHPAVWWLSSQIRMERENCCDDVAIALCGNSITYAKALVSVQEMAYYSPMMTMAFAGNQRKKHLLMRVQRVLNQPKSNINIMEKMASTTILVAFVACLAFGSSYSNSTPNLNKSTTQVSDNQTISNKKDFYLKYYLDGKLDSFPLGKNIADGKYSFSDNTQQIDLVIKDKNVIQFNINGLDVASKDIPKFEKLIDKIVNAKNAPSYPDEMDLDRWGNFNGVDNAAMIDLEGAITDKNGALIDLEAALEQKNEAFSDLKKYGINMNGDGEDEMTITDKKGNATHVIFEDHKATQIVIENGKNQSKSILLEDDGTLMMDGKKLSQKGLRKLGWEVKGDALEPIGGFKDVHFNFHGVPDMPNIPPMPNVNYPLPNPNDYNYHFDDATEDFSDELSDKIEAALLKDGYIKKDRPSYFSLYDKVMMVDDQKYDGDVLKKYKKIYEQATKSKFKTSTMININFGTDDGEEEANSDATENNDYNDEIANALYRDGLLKDINNFKIHIDDKSMVVNGKKVSDAQFQKYKKIFKTNKNTNIDIVKDTK